MTGMSVFAGDGQETNGRKGGDGCVGEFTKAARDVHQWLVSHGAENKLSIDPAAFIKALNGAHIDSTDKPIWVHEMIKFVNYLC